MNFEFVIWLVICTAFYKPWLIENLRFIFEDDHVIQKDLHC